MLLACLFDLCVPVIVGEWRRFLVINTLLVPDCVSGLLSLQISARRDRNVEKDTGSEQKLVGTNYLFNCHLN